MSEIKYFDPGGRKLQVTVVDQESGESLLTADMDIRLADWSTMREKCGAFAPVFAHLTESLKWVADGNGELTAHE